MNSKKLSVIIVNYNTKDILRDCLHNIGNKYFDKEVIVVDNGSPDKSAEMVKTEFPEVKLIECENIGLAAGSNKGLEIARGDYMLFLGSDVFPEADTLEQMAAYMESNKDVGISTCKLVLRNGTADVDAHRGFPTPWAALTHFAGLDKIFLKSRLFSQYFLGYKNSNEIHEIDLCISHFMLIKKEVFETVGRWDEDYFVYGEDVDFCYRAKQAGWKIVYIPQFKALHYKGPSVGIRNESKEMSTTKIEIRKKMIKQTTEAMKKFYQKHYVNKYPKYISELVFIGINVIEKLRSFKL